ncbi:hypothetical protein Bpro_1274 [Polaromonas sp. JS666]|nr:hypothetical protein Bpro_1274 [Polaromonas sp. JS666]
MTDSGRPREQAECPLPRLLQSLGQRRMVACKSPMAAIPQPDLETPVVKRCEIEIEWAFIKSLYWSIASLYRGHGRQTGRLSSDGKHLSPVCLQRLA